VLLERLYEERLLRIEHRRADERVGPDESGRPRWRGGPCRGGRRARWRSCRRESARRRRAGGSWPATQARYRSASASWGWFAAAKTAVLLRAAGAGERLVPDESANDSAERAAGPPRPRPRVNGGMGGDLDRGRRLRGARGRRGAHHRGGRHLLATLMRHFRTAVLRITRLPLAWLARPSKLAWYRCPAPRRLARRAAAEPLRSSGGRGRIAGRGRRRARTQAARRPQTATIPGALSESARKWTIDVGRAITDLLDGSCPARFGRRLGALTPGLHSSPCRHLTTREWPPLPVSG
jgi:hypothetical protein